MRKLLLAVALPVVFSAGFAIAAEYGSPAEAKEMLERAVAALKADKAKALQMFNERGEGFGDRDLYVYCGGADGMFTAHYNENVRKMSLKELKDKDGSAFGEEIYAVAEPGVIAEVEYKWNRPGSEDLVDKVAYVTREGGEICAVGYYK
ncbi:MAG: cache domain-containing protein [Rhodospirillales bacterium]